jgi:hypothetical protein
MKINKVIREKDIPTKRDCPINTHEWAKVSKEDHLMLGDWIVCSKCGKNFNWITDHE